MATDTRLRGRDEELSAPDRLLKAVRAGESRALVVRRELGVGKSEMQRAFAGLPQVCAPMLDRLGCLPDPRRDALATAFGLSAGHAPDRFLVSLAVLSLLSEVATERRCLPGG